MKKYNTAGLKMVLWGLIIPILVFLLVFNGSYAYFTATAKAQNSTTTTAIIKIGFTDDIDTTIKESGATVTRAKLIPGDSVTFKGTVQNTGTADLYAIVSYELEVIKTDNTSSVVKSGYLNAAGSELVLGDGVYTTAATPMAVNATNSFEVSHEFDFFEYDNTYKNAQVIFRAKAQAIQQSNIASASAATFILMEKFNPVPAEYKQLTYLQSTGTQYIDTGYKPNQDTSIEFDGYMATSAMSYSLFGINPSFTLTSASANYYIMRINGISRNFSKEEIPSNERRAFYVNKNKFYVNSVLLYTFNYSSFTSPYNMYLFARNNSSNNLEEATGTKYCYSCKIWDNDVLVRSFYPVKRLSDGKLGMFDAVNRVFYTNAGTGEFVAGDECLVDNLGNSYQQVEYIQSTGTQYIDTGYKPNQDTSIEFDGYMATSAMSYSLFGINPSFTLTSASANYYIMRINGISRNFSKEEIPSNERRAFYVNKNKFYVNSVLLYTFNYSSFTSPYNMYLFARNNSSNNLEEATGIKYCYSCKIWDNDVLVRSFYPVERISDGEVGMFDAVNRVFYTNAGTGDFVAGPNV